MVWLNLFLYYIGFRVFVSDNRHLFECSLPQTSIPILATIIKRIEKNESNNLSLREGNSYLYHVYMY